MVASKGLPSNSVYSATVGVAPSHPRAVERGTPRSVATVTSPMRWTRLRSRWSLRSLARRRDLAIQAQIHSHLAVDVPRVADQEVHDARPRRRAEKARRHRSGLQHRLVGLLLDESRSVVE